MTEQLGFFGEGSMAEKKDNKAKGSAIDYEQYREDWNLVATAQSLRTLRKMTASRVTHLKRRMREEGENFWPQLLDEVRHLNAFALGDNRQGWKLDFDYCMTPQGCAKLLEGAYREDGPHGDESLSLDDVLDGK